jgi:Ni/Fe-hydrogenase subunit HybB-like protein
MFNSETVINLINKMGDPKVSFTLIVLMFLMSGINKVYTFDTVVVGLKQKIQYDLPIVFYNIVIAIVVLLEIIAPIIIINYAVTGSNKQWAYYSTIGLILFTILTTIIYHPPYCSNYTKCIPFWANISLIGGLSLLAKNIQVS